MLKKDKRPITIRLSDEEMEGVRELAKLDHLPGHIGKGRGKGRDGGGELSPGDPCPLPGACEAGEGGLVVWDCSLN